jgi:IclR family transcriptional regulator, acetate operon repressor
MAYSIPIVEKTIRVINAIAAEPGGGGGGAGSMHQLAKQLDIAPSTCFRILRTLQAEGWIAERRAGGWELSAGLVRLLDGLAPVQTLIDAARDPLDRLVARTKLSGKLSVRQGDVAVTVLRSDSPAAFAMSGRLGATFPLAVGSSGAALCADLSEAEVEALIKRSPDSAFANQSPDAFRARAAVARSGKPVFDPGSYHPSVHTLSLAIRDARGDVAGAITLIGVAGDITEKSLPATQRALAAAAREVEQALRPVNRRSRT